MIVEWYCCCCVFRYHIPVCDNDGLLQHLEDDEMDEQQLAGQGFLTSVSEQARLVCRISMSAYRCFV